MQKLTLFLALLLISDTAQATKTVIADVIKPSGAGTITTFPKNVVIDKDFNVNGTTHLNGKVVIKPLTALTKTGGAIKGLLNTNIAGTRAGTGTGPAAVAWSPLSNYIAVANQNSNNVQTFSVDSLGNISAALSSQPTGNVPTSVTWSPNWSSTTGGFIAVANNSDNTVQTFKVDASGNLTSVSSQTAGTFPYSVAWSPNKSATTGGFLAVVNNDNANTVETLSVDTAGNLSSVISSLTTGASPLSVAFSPIWSTSTGGFIAAANGGDNSLQTFAVDTSGHLTLVSVATTASVPDSVAWAPQGNFVVVSNQDGNNIQVFTVDASGHLSTEAKSAQNVGAVPISVTWSPIWSALLGGNVAVANSGTNTVQTFSVDITGNLSSSQTGYANTGSFPYSAAWSPSGLYIAVTNTGSNTVQIFNAATI